MKEGFNSLLTPTKWRDFHLPGPTCGLAGLSGGIGKASSPFLNAAMILKSLVEILQTHLLISINALFFTNFTSESKISLEFLKEKTRDWGELEITFQGHISEFSKERK